MILKWCLRARNRASGPDFGRLLIETVLVIVTVFVSANPTALMQQIQFSTGVRVVPAHDDGKSTLNKTYL
jgi:hypothetical protein